ncbi:MAG: hypothetical protein EA424_12640 [Planctomycetaceae bacterium]|nr:MAG: hypothetical protein EA424_12640 [Planctomycetaceae bacterium]
MLVVVTVSSVSAGNDRARRAVDGDRFPAASNDDTLESFLDRTIVERRDRVRRLNQGIRSLLDRMTEQTIPETDDNHEPSQQLQTLPPDEPDVPELLEDPQTPVSAPEAPRPKLPLATPVTDRPVDRLAAADNLFGAGDIQHALALYRQLRQADLPEAERRWICYQIACCQRRMGEINGATKDYRELANDAVNDAVSENARWFIEVISQRHNLSSNVQNLTAILQSLEEEIRNEFAP